MVSQELSGRGCLVLFPLAPRRGFQVTSDSGWPKLCSLPRSLIFINMIFKRFSPSASLFTFLRTNTSHFDFTLCLWVGFCEPLWDEKPAFSTWRKSAFCRPEELSHCAGLPLLQLSWENTACAVSLCLRKRQIHKRLEPKLKKKPQR